MLWRIVTTFAVAGIIVDSQGYIIRTAPIFRWALHQPLDRLVDFYASKGKLLEAGLVGPG